MEEQDTIRLLVEEIRELSPAKQKALLVALRSRHTKDFSAAVQEDPNLDTVDLETIAATYNISTRTLLRYIDSGKLKATRFGRKLVVTVAELRRFLKAA